MNMESVESSQRYTTQQLQAPPTTGLRLLWLAECSGEAQGEGAGFHLEEEKAEEEREVLRGGEEEDEEDAERHGGQQGEAGQSEAAAAPGGVVCQERLRRLVHRVVWERERDINTDWEQRDVQLADSTRLGAPSEHRIKC